MKTLIVGGNINTGKESSIINELGEFFNDIKIYNGIIPDSIQGFDMTIWMPNYPNTWDKIYPKKDVRSVLICSKVMREGYTHVDSCSRIFKTHGNAVIEIYKENDTYLFELRDALNHCWCRKTRYVSVLYEGIMNFYKWSKESKRESLCHKPQFQILDDEIDMELYYKFIQINKKLADKVAVGCGNRFFGNYSTRCTKLFPSFRQNKDLFLFSPRNTDKQYITVDDRVVCNYEDYYGDRKPSVDTPVQLKIYKEFPWINYMIHGHAYIGTSPMTENYYPCGDLREVDGVIRLIKQGWKRINLKSHGFLLIGETIEDMQHHFNKCYFKPIFNYNVVKKSFTSNLITKPTFTSSEKYIIQLFLNRAKQNGKTLENAYKAKYSFNTSDQEVIQVFLNIHKQDFIKINCLLQQLANI